VCADPFHIIKLANAAVDEVRRAAWNSARRAAGVARPGPLARVRQDPAAQTLKHTRWALLKDPASWTDSQRQVITRLRRARHVLFRAWALKEELRDLYRLPEGRRADAYLDAWLARASRSRIPAMVDLSRTIRRHCDQILAPARPVQQQTRRPQLQDSADQPPRLRPPQRRRRHRDDLPVLLRPDHHAAHRKVRRTSFHPSPTELSVVGDRVRRAAGSRCPLTRRGGWRTGTCCCSAELERRKTPIFGVLSMSK
jgi:transposase